MTPLEATPNQFRKITDDTDAKALLVQYGILEKLLEHRRPAHLSGEWSASLHFPGHPTHWISAVRYEGFTNPADNGYVLHCIPKSQCSFEQFRAALRAGVHTLFPSGVESSETGKLQPPLN